jgi:hypothetical protein
MPSLVGATVSVRGGSILYQENDARWVYVALKAGLDPE